MGCPKMDHNCDKEATQLLKEFFPPTHLFEGDQLPTRLFITSILSHTSQRGPRPLQDMYSGLKGCCMQHSLARSLVFMHYKVPRTQTDTQDSGSKEGDQGVSRV